MTIQGLPTQVKPDHNSLTELHEGLPAHYYFDAPHYERELDRIWFRNWIYAGRSEDLHLPRSFRTFSIGAQRILLVRDEAGDLQGFHNTCRHRGAALCRETQGQLRTSAIICPYHAWTYDLQGKLLRTSSKSHAQGFDVRDFALYRICVQEWNGCVFVAFTDSPPPLHKSFDQPFNRLDHWSLGDLRRGHVFTKTMSCNWKVFWENYNECLHCPGVHQQLSQLVPIFGRGLLEERDDPSWTQHAASTDPKFKGGLRVGATTWSMNGQRIDAPLPGLTEEDRKAAHVYLTILPSVFIVGHPDYVRLVALRPLGPEQTEMCVEYLFAAQTLADPRFELSNAVDFANRVMTEDAQICELNQQGLRALPHRRGVVMPEEYLVQQFHDWLRQQMLAD
jgi:phenylpropionate dioxygenase-like ring-hydroxylating dioxygenase large terminal subunit